VTLARPRPRTPARGMTFLELMVAMIILGLLLAVAVPRMVGAGQMSQLRGAARDIVSLMKFARSTAIFGEIEVELRFNPDAGVYGLNFDPVALMTNRRLARRSRGYSSGAGRHAEEEARDRAEQWLRVHEFPKDRLGQPTVHFKAVETELEVPSLEARRTTLPAVVFYTDGTASGGTIILENQSGAMMSIDVLTATALAKVGEGDSRESRDEGDTP
jgi:prepilin-type N-terminal cleavage/methylation domain-containing protein